jgi:pyridoxal phosphate enzyme (YggS family)
LAEIRERVARAAQRSGRGASEVTIVAVSKAQSAAAIGAALDAGQRDFGESYVQEALPKIAALKDRPAVWHFVGHLQANKTRAVAERFHWAHTIDREKIAVRLNDQRPQFAPPLNVLIQINLANEPQKAGAPESEAVALARTIGRLPRLALRGLMTIPPARASSDEKRASFMRLRHLRERLAAEGIPTDTLSMGMSEDFETAIEAGSTCVRIGTAIFGERARRPPG